MTRKMFLSAAVGLAAIAGAAGIALAQTSSHMSVRINSNGKGHLAGTVASVSGSSITVNSWGGAWIVNASDVRLSPRGDSGAFTLADIKTGDQVAVDGAFATSGWAITARSVRDDSVQVRPVASSGTVSAVSGTGFTLTLHNGKTLQVHITASTTVKANEDATTSALMNGDRVRVRGILDTSDSVITASHIMIR